MSDGLSFIAFHKSKTIRRYSFPEFKPYPTKFDPLGNSRNSFQADVSDMNLSRDPYLVVPTDNRFVHIYNVETGKIISKLAGHFSRINCIKIRRGREVILLRTYSHYWLLQEFFTGGQDHEIIYWQPTLRQPEPEKVKIM